MKEEVTGDLPIEITEKRRLLQRRPGRIRRKFTTTSGSPYLRGHLGAVQHAIVSGVPVRAYHCWSLMDNFEWARGFRCASG